MRSWRFSSIFCEFNVNAAASAPRNLRRHREPKFLGDGTETIVPGPELCAGCQAHQRKQVDINIADPVSKQRLAIDEAQDFGVGRDHVRGRDEAALDHARAEWRRLKDQGRTISYWREGDEGGWERAR